MIKPLDVDGSNGAVVVQVADQDAVQDSEREQGNDAGRKREDPSTASDKTNSSSYPTVVSAVCLCLLLLLELPLLLLQELLTCSAYQMLRARPRSRVAATTSTPTTTDIEAGVPRGCLGPRSPGGCRLGVVACAGVVAERGWGVDAEEGG